MAPHPQELVLRLKRDRSFATLEKLAYGNPTSQSVQKVVSPGFTRMPAAETFEGLSRALNVSERELVLAAARTLGIDIEKENPNDLPLIGAGRLPQVSWELLRSTSRELQLWLDKSSQKGPTEAAQDEPVTNVHDLLQGDKSQRSAADNGNRNIDPGELPED